LGNGAALSGSNSLKCASVVFAIPGAPWWPRCTANPRLQDRVCELWLQLDGEPSCARLAAGRLREAVGDAREASEGARKRMRPVVPAAGPVCIRSRFLGERGRGSNAARTVADTLPDRLRASMHGSSPLRETRRGRRA
jgi:hypothetical protein